MTDFTEPNDRAIYVQPDGRLTSTGLKLFRAVWKLLGGYQSLDQETVINRAQLYSSLTQPVLPQVRVSGSQLVQSVATVDGFAVSLNMAPVTLAVLSALPEQPTPKLPAYDAQPILAAAFYGA